MPMTWTDIHQNVVIVWKLIDRCITSSKTYHPTQYSHLRRQSLHRILKKIDITYSGICPHVAPVKLYKNHKMVVLPLLFRIHQKPVTVFALFKSAACVREGVKKTGKIGQADRFGGGGVTPPA